MPEEKPLIPPPEVIRLRLAQNIREARLLRALLRLSLKAIEEGIDLDRMADEDLIPSPIRKH